MEEETRGFKSTKIGLKQEWGDYGAIMPHCRMASSWVHNKELFQGITMNSPIFDQDREKEKLLSKPICEDCNRPIHQNKGSLTSWIFAESNCKCSAKSRAVSIDSADTLQESRGARLSVPVNSNIDLGERYQVHELIGQGGMGAVYKVWDKHFSCFLAVKVLHPELAHEPQAQKRFAQEAAAAMVLNHPNLATVYSNGVSPAGAPYLVMEFIDGENLANIIKRDAYLDTDRVLTIAAQTCEALSHAHAKGIVHRDLKPSNVLLVKNKNGEDCVKLVDFGIAKILPSFDHQHHNLTQTGELFGSPFYMSPEQCQGETVDSRSDIYSMGCLLYEASCGRPPFVNANPVKIILGHLNEQPVRIVQAYPALNVSDDFDGIIQRCLEKEPTERYQRVEDLLKDINRVRTGLPPSSRGDSAAHALLSRRSAWRRYAALLIDGSLVGAFHLSLWKAIMCYQALYLTANHTVVPPPTQSLAHTLFNAVIIGTTDCVLPLYDAESRIRQMMTMNMAVPLNLFHLSIMTIFILLTVIANWLYHALMESSKARGTVGKMALRLQITDMRGQNISFKKSTIRHFAKILSFFCSVGLLAYPVRMLGSRYFKWKRVSFDDYLYRRTLHDKLGKCFVTLKKVSKAALPDKQSKQRAKIL